MKAETPSLQTTDGPRQCHVVCNNLLFEFWFLWSIIIEPSFLPASSLVAPGTIFGQAYVFPVVRLQRGFPVLLCFLFVCNVFSACFNHVSDVIRICTIMCIPYFRLFGF